MQLNGTASGLRREHMHEHVSVGLAAHGFRAAPLFSATTSGGTKSTRLNARAILVVVIFCSIDADPPEVCVEAEYMLHSQQVNRRLPLHGAGSQIAIYSSSMVL